MKCFFVVAAAAASVSALTVEESHVGRFNNWKLQHGKAYKSIEEEEARFEIFMSNHATIESHNADASNTYTKGHNEYSDMTEDEFKSLMNGLVFPVGHKSTAGNVHKSSATEPSAIDWRKKGAVTAVKNQEECGSCWAFATTGSVEGQNLIQNGGSASDDANILSEQQLVDCSSENRGCHGGNVDLAFEYLMDVTDGDDTEKSYPYTARDGYCSVGKGTPSNVRVTSYTDVDGESDLKNAVGNVGPVAVAVDAGPFQFYSSGIISDNCGRQLDHGVLVVGYGTEDGQDYWIIKNSWGTSWGEDGYVRVGMGKNLCGVADRASYPTIE